MEINDKHKEYIYKIVVSNKISIIDLTLAIQYII